MGVHVQQDADHEDLAKTGRWHFLEAHLILAVAHVEGMTPHPESRTYLKCCSVQRLAPENPNPRMALIQEWQQMAAEACPEPPREGQSPSEA